MDAAALKKHVRYFERHFVYFPDAYQKYDSSHTSLVYFCILGLQLLGKPVPREFVPWVWDHHTRGGFKGSLSHPDGDFSISSTYFCLSILAMAQSPLLPGLGEEIRESVAKLQLPNGSFCGSLYRGSPGSEPSLRHMYSSLGSLFLVGGPTENPKALEYVLACQNYDGGFGEFPGSESHAGLTYCAITSIVKFCRYELDPEVRSRVVAYLLHCQKENGGFNGRVNKDTDTCYSFWAGATLKVLGVELYNNKLGREYLYGCQHAIGGMYKTRGELPDPLHSALGLAALSIFGETELATLDAGLCVPKSAAAWATSGFRCYTG